MAENPLSASENIPEAKGVDVTDENGQTQEYVNVQKGKAVFRDGGPYGDEVDAIRDENRNAAREGRSPNYDALVPDQYLAIPKEELKASTIDNVPSLERAILQGAVTVGAVDVDYSKGDFNVDDSKTTTVEPSTGGDPVNSENVTKAVDPFANLGQ